MNPRSVPDLCPKRRLRGRFLPARLAKKAVELPIPQFYAAYVRDPDGNKLNAVCYQPDTGAGQG